MASVITFTDINSLSLSFLFEIYLVCYSFKGMERVDGEQFTSGNNQRNR